MTLGIEKQMNGFSQYYAKLHFHINKYVLVQNTQASPVTYQIKSDYRKTAWNHIPFPKCNCGFYTRGCETHLYHLGNFYICNVLPTYSFAKFFYNIHITATINEIHYVPMKNQKAMQLFLRGQIRDWKHATTQCTVPTGNSICIVERNTLQI